MYSWPQALQPAPTDLAPPPQRPPLTCPRSASASRHSIQRVIGTEFNRSNQDLKRNGNLDLAVLWMWHKMSHSLCDKGQCTLSAGSKQQILPRCIRLVCQTTTARPLSRQCPQQRLGLLQVGRVKAFCEPVIDRHQQVIGLGTLTLALPEADQTHRSSQLQGFRLLAAGDAQGLAKTGFH